MAGSGERVRFFDRRRAHAQRAAREPLGDAPSFGRSPHVHDHLALDATTNRWHDRAMRILKMLALPMVAALALALAVTFRMHADAATPVATFAAQSVAPPALPVPPVTAAADPEPAPAEVPKLDALHQYAVDAVLTLTPPYAERNFESADDRKARWTNFALQCATAVQESDVPWNEQHEYVLTLIWIAHRETLIAKDPFNVGNCDEGTSLGPWSMKEWRGVDRWSASGALTLLLAHPQAWSLPQPKPWLGIVADRGKHGVNRPSVMEYLRAHPFTP